MNVLIKLILIVIFLAPAQVKAEPWQSMKMIGSGEYQYLGFITLYQARYFTESGKIGQPGLAHNKCLVLDYKVGITAEQFTEAANNILAQQLPRAELETLRPLIDQLHNSYQSVKDGDRYSLCFDRETESTSLALNGQTLVTVPSQEFATAYFAIWLGEREPIDDELRDELLNSRTTSTGRS